MPDRTPTDLDEMGPVDYLVVEFPAGAAELHRRDAAEELARLSESGAIRILDLLILAEERGRLGRRRSRSTRPPTAGSPPSSSVRLETDVAEILAAEDVELLAEAMEPGSVAGRAGVREPLGRPVRQRHPPRRADS